MYKIYFIIVALLLGITAEAQKNKDEFKEKYFEAYNYTQAGRYQKALDLYLEIIEWDKANLNIKFLIGGCYLNIPLEREKAIKYLKQASKTTLPEGEYEVDDWQSDIAPFESKYYLGKAYHVNYQFDKAIEVFEELLPEISDYNFEIKDDTERGIEMCKNGKELMALPVNMEVENLGKKINSQYAEHSPVVNADETMMFFTAKRPDGVGNDKVEDEAYFEDLYFVKKENEEWGTPQNAGSRINTPQHDASIGMSFDGMELLIYRNDKDNGDIYLSTFDGDSWGEPQKLPEPINTKYNENHASFSADGNFLYFTSDRKGGKGGLDIYVCRRLPNGQWSDAQNLGDKINTKYDEQGPFLHPDGQTLFFSSKGHKSMGGLDIFYAVRDDSGGWLEPKNIGYPINTTTDDVFYMPTLDGKRAYYASEQKDGFGSTDIYLINVVSLTKPLAVVSGIIKLKDNKIPEEPLTVTEVDNPYKDPQIYRANPKNGSYIMVLSPGTEYIVSCNEEGHLPYRDILTVAESKNFEETHQTVSVPEIILSKKYSSIYIPHVQGEMQNSSKALIANLIEYMVTYENLNVEIIANENEAPAIAKKQSVYDQFTDEGIEAAKLGNKVNLPDVPEKNYELFIYNPEYKDEAMTVLENRKSGIVAQADTKTTEQEVNNNENDNQSNDDSEVVGDVVIENVLFGFDKYTTNNYYRNLDLVVSYMLANPKAKIEITGHTDEQGPKDYNMVLSKKRAGFVKDYLVKKGVKEENIVIKGLGESKPISVNLNPQTRKYNRRAEFKFIKKGRKVTIKPIEVPVAYQLNN